MSDGKEATAVEVQGTLNDNPEEDDDELLKTAGRQVKSSGGSSSKQPANELPMGIEAPNLGVGGHAVDRLPSLPVRVVLAPKIQRASR